MHTLRQLSNYWPSKIPTNRETKTSQINDQAKHCILTSMVTFRLPHTRAAMVGLEETKVSTMVVNFCTLWRVFYSLPATHRLLRLALPLSISAVNWRTAIASGVVFIAKSFAFCSTDNAFWKSLKAATSGSILASFNQDWMALMLRCLLHIRHDSTLRGGPRWQ